MMRQRWLTGLMVVLGLALVVAAGCQPAMRYGTEVAEKPDAKEEDKEPLVVPAHYGYLEPQPTWDRPIKFVASDHPEWAKLPDYWNALPHAGGPPTLLFGLSPLEVTGGLRLALEQDAVKIKVPLGLPDPTPYLPASNPPTVGKWALGKRLFFEPLLLPVTKTLGQSCASCHNPAEGFTLWEKVPPRTDRNVASLINVVYNKHLFYDGRGDGLEQAIHRGLSDEGAPIKTDIKTQSQEYHHRWGGVVKRLRGNDDYLAAFVRVFGTAPTVDNVGKALATYMRTILSGNSLYDRAEKRRSDAKAATLTAEHFQAELGADALKGLGREGKEAKEVAAELARGYAVYKGRANCVQCHPAPLFTDQDFHNLGLLDGAFEFTPVAGAETGRFKYLPPGLQDRKYVGAFRTLTLRNLPRTGPYFHDRSKKTLTDVLEYYNQHMNADLNAYLDPAFTYRTNVIRRPNLTGAELQALEVFLLALDGEKLPAKITEMK